MKLSRKLAVTFLRHALKIAPPHAAVWGRAMLGELPHIEGDWSALAWALGGVGMLARHALLSLMIPVRPDQIASEGKFFARENPMKKSTLIAVAVCFVAFLLLFAVPSFRQALSICVAQGRTLALGLREYYVPFDQQPEFNRQARQADYDARILAFAKVADKARKNHDAEGLAFAAIHRFDRPDSSRLAGEAVHLNPQLTWIYAMIARRNQPLPEFDDMGAKTRAVRSTKRDSPSSGCEQAARGKPIGA